MSLSVPREVVSAMRSESADGQPVWLLHIYEDGTDTATLRLCNDTQSITGPDGQRYEPYPFKVSLPSQTGANSPVVRVTAFDIPLRIVDDLVRSAGTRQSIKANIYVVQRGVLRSDGSGHEAINTFKSFDMVNAVNTRTTLRVDLTVRNYLDVPLTKHWYGPQGFPGLF